MTNIPETALDYVILSRDQAVALTEYFKHSYIHYDNQVLHETVNKIGAFVDRNGHSHPQPQPEQ